MSIKVFTDILTKRLTLSFNELHTLFGYHKVTSSNTSRLEAHAGFFRLLMKGIFDPCVLYSFDKKLVSQLVTGISTRDSTVNSSIVPLFYVALHVGGLHIGRYARVWSCRTSSRQM